MKNSKIDFLNKFFANTSDVIDIDAIYNAWMVLDDVYDIETWQLPMPLWANRPYDELGDYAWKTLQLDLAKKESKKAVCIYIHVPFCSRKCGFCDSYSFKLKSHRNTHVTQYEALLRSELKLWHELGNLSLRPISTIHFGGGTPTSIGTSAIAGIIHYCKENFSVSDSTELAIETTVEDLTQAAILALHDIGFRRLHIGIQSMQSDVRQTIGRLSSATAALKSIEVALSHGWVVSTDLLYGLPGQTLEGFIQGIDDLISAGVNGFSMYELIIRKQNYQWALKNNLIGRSHLTNYLMAQAGAFYLETHGYKKNFYNHWADDKDKNLYFTFPTRGEDCLAIGTIADGVFGDYHYRHPNYAKYIRRNDGYTSILEGGLRKRPFEKLLHPFETAIFSGLIEENVENELYIIQKDIGNLFDKWHKHKMFERNQKGEMELTTNGTWFIGDLTNELATHFQNTV